MDTFVELLIKLSLVAATFIFALRMLCGFAPPLKLGNRFLGRSIGVIFSIIAAKAFITLMEDFITFSYGFKLFLFVVFLTVNISISFTMFSTKNKGPERTIYYGRPKPTTRTRTRPTRGPEQTRRPRQQPIRSER